MRLGRHALSLFYAFMLAYPTPISGVEMAPAPINIEVKPRIAPAPATITVRVAVPPDADNRSVCVTLDGDEGFRQSCFEHVGEAAPQHLEVVLRDMPEGAYTASASVAGVNGRHALSRAVEVCVTGQETSASDCFGDVAGVAER